MLGPLFRNIAGKVQHRVMDNVADVGPPVGFFIALVSFVKWKRAEILYHHRD